MRASGKNREGVLGRFWRVLVALPAAALALVPSFTCPACLAAYTGVLSSLGLSFLLTERILVPLIVLFLAVGIWSVARASRSHRRKGPLVLTIVGSVGIVVGRLLFSSPALLYLGAGLMLGASFWNLWLKRPRTRPLANATEAQP